MSVIFYAEEEESITKEDSINNYNYLFLDFIKKPPNIEEALRQMFFSYKAPTEKINDLVEDIFKKSKRTIEKNFDQIRKEYPNISKDEAIIISSYTCESKQVNYSPYKMLNRALVSKNRKLGLENVSKYLFILLRSLRKLKRYYPDPESNFLYRCINVKVNVDPKSKDPVPYIKGNKKTFWGFTSTSTSITLSYEFLGEKKDFKSGTIFHISGNIWGYDITLFNYYLENEVLLEPERKIFIYEQQPEINNIINIRCKILDTPIVLNNEIKPLEDNNKKNKLFNGENQVNNYTEEEIKFSKNKGIEFKFNNNEINNNNKKINEIINTEIDKNKQSINYKNQIMKKKFNEIYNLKEKIEKENGNIKIKNNKEIKEEVKIKENIIKSKNIKTDMIKIYEEKIKYKNEINLIYKTNEKGKEKIFGKEFVENNKKNIELIINNKKSNLIDEYELEQGVNKIKLIIKNNLENIKKMFYESKSLYNIEELKYLDISKCTDFSSMFFNCSSLSDIKTLEK